MALTRASRQAAVSGGGPEEWGARCMAWAHFAEGETEVTERKGSLGQQWQSSILKSRCPDALSSALPHLLLTPQACRGVTLSSKWAGAEGPCLPLSTVYNSTCDDREFMCQNRQCIPKHFMCDHDRDCADGSDESPECGEPGAAVAGALLSVHRPPASPAPSNRRVPNLRPQRVPLRQRALPELPPVGVRR